MLVYKYCSADTAKEIIRNGTLKFTKPSDFNDAFDCDLEHLKFDFSSKSSIIDSELDTLLRSMIETSGLDIPFEEFKTMQLSRNDLWEEAYKKAQQRKMDVSGILCFSIDHLSNPMWGHYAKEHTGICLGFDLSTDKLFHNFNDDEITNDIVEYGFNPNEPTNYFNNPEAAIKKILFTKSKEWEYEKELRLAILYSVGYQPFNKRALKKVILGLKTPIIIIDELKKICYDNGYDNIEFSRIEKDKFELREVKVSMIN